jgi:hypothetical protein
MIRIFQNFLIIVMISSLFSVFAQETGMRKSLTDDRTGQTYNNFRTDSTEAVFYRVLKSGEFMYGEPKNNAEAVYSLDAEMFVETVGKTEENNFLKVRVLDKFHGIIDGWVRPAILNKAKYFGKSYSGSKKSLRTIDFDKRVNPLWLKNDFEIVYNDSTLSGTAAGTLKKGDVLFAGKINSEIAVPVYFTNQDGILVKGFISRTSVSEFAVIDKASNDFDVLFKKYDPVLLRNDIDRAAFISFSGINFYNRDAKEFTEDKVCREISPDTLHYKYTISSNINDIKKRTDVRKRFEKAGIAMYRFLPDENIITRKDTVKCTVLEYVSIPKSAKIVVGGTEEVSVTNLISKLYITNLENFDMDIVFHKETTTYEWTYSRNISTGETVKSNTNIEKIVKRMIAFRKH